MGSELKISALNCSFQACRGESGTFHPHLELVQDRIPINTKFSNLTSSASLRAMIPHGPCS